jgi:hypothetical protein
MSENGYSQLPSIRDRQRLEKLRESKNLLDIEISSLALELRKIRSGTSNPALKMMLHLIIAAATSALLVGLFFLIDSKITLETSLVALMGGTVSMFFILQRFSSDQDRWQKDVEKNLHRLELRRASIEGQILELESIHGRVY